MERISGLLNRNTDFYLAANYTDKFSLLFGLFYIFIPYLWNRISLQLSQK